MERNAQLEKRLREMQNEQNKLLASKKKCEEKVDTVR